MVLLPSLGSLSLTRNPSTQSSGIRDYLKKKYIKVRRVDSADNMADPLTKQLSQPKIEVHLEKMGLRLIAN